MMSCDGGKIQRKQIKASLFATGMTHSPVATRALQFDSALFHHAALRGFDEFNQVVNFGQPRHFGFQSFKGLGGVQF